MIPPSGRAPSQLTATDRLRPFRAASDGHIDAVGQQVPALLGDQVDAERHQLPLRLRTLAVSSNPGRLAGPLSQPEPPERVSPPSRCSSRPPPPDHSLSNADALMKHADIESVDMRENLWRTACPTPVACLQVLKDLVYRLAVGWLETTWKLCVLVGMCRDEQ